MPRVPTGRRKYNITHMWQHHHEILRLVLLGHKPADIAQLLGVTPQTVSNTVNSPLGRAKLALMRAERDQNSVNVAAVIKDLQGNALDVVAEFVDPEKGKNKDDRLRLKAAFDLLDRGGHAAPKVIQAQHMHAVIQPQDMVEIKRRSDAARQAGLIVEAEVVHGT